MSELPEKIPLIILDSSESLSSFVTHHTKYMVGLPSFPSFEWTFLVIDTLKGEDLILCFDFLNYFNPSIDWNNDFSSAESCVALVGHSRRPSIPSSVHIPSLNCHQSLLSSKDEVLKEIQDAGEDNSVSSLHLFFGNMDLPPSSYHDSLEELWDEVEEPEELETVIKVVPSAYHQYLDVFSKVKAEKLSPHCACDHHIELEGSLPPVGVILSQPWQFTSLDLRMAYQATVLLWPIGHIHHQWPIWPHHHLMDHLWPFVFWGIHGPSPQSRRDSGNLCPIWYYWSFPSKPGEMAQMAVLAI
ncbi:hypothetical protein O181_074975 [Austropuccinia psidii MF-1]|uniref:Uncharacterized protein n=1 Tax=Austropuccinia psidii MF-1 TaxID=1389203 RepID=A0A9Q3F5N6_9BASI|nr:hypothetical protein [Austropuccinia psidii MF-1]